MPGPWRRLILLPVLAGWVVLVLLAGHFAWNLVARAIAARSGFVPGFRMELMENWKTALLVALLACLWVVARLGSRLVTAGGGLRPLGAAGWLAGVALAALAGQAWLYLGDASAHGPNRWGFYRAWGPNSSSSGLECFPGFPPMQVTVNAESYRDDWQLPPREDGTIRVLLVGDSNVFGHGIPDKSGTLDVFLEKALNAAGAARWDVWNVANHPAALWYSTEAIRRIAPDAHPRYAVLYVDDTDLTFVDEQRALADQPGWFYSLERHVGLYDDLLWMWHHTGWPAEKVQRNSAVVAAGREAFERLLAFADAQGVGLVVWEAVGPLRFFDPYRGRPGLAFVDWRNAIGARCPAQRGVCTWRDDPTFAYPDGHPLPATNGRIAGAVARALMELERSPRREDVHHLDRGE